MNNQQATEYFSKLSNGNILPTTTKINTCNDFSEYDAKFILKFAQGLNVLDLASGTGITVNKYSDKVKKVTAVEKFKKFSDLIDRKPNVKVINEDIFKFNTDEKFDIITMFGIMHYCNSKEAEKIYLKYKKNLQTNGKLLIKQQFGIKEDVVVSGYSKELKENYYSEYRCLEHEIAILQKCGYESINAFDIYPAVANRWDNTHFWAIVAKI